MQGMEESRTGSDTEEVSEMAVTTKFPGVERTAQMGKEG